MSEQVNDGWRPISTAPRNVVVLTKIHDELGPRNEQQLRRRAEGDLWWFADGSMYVYYIPTHWMPLPSPPSPEAQDATTTEPAAEPSEHGLSFSDIQRIQAEALEQVAEELAALSIRPVHVTDWLRSKASALREAS